MKIRDLYKAILEATGAIVNDDGLVSMTLPGEEPIPLMVKEKRLAMPTEKLLNAGAFNPDGSLIAFHPICENVVLNPSPVLQQLEKMMAFKLSLSLRELFVQLVAVAADPKQHKKLKMKAHGLLSALPDADERTRNDLTKIFESTTATGQKKLLSLYVRSGGMFNGEKVSRLGRFFPSVVDQLDEEKRSVLGVSLRKADVPAFLALVEYVLPEYKDPDKYAAPSNALVAPTFHALVKVYGKVANQINKVVDIHAAQLDDPDALRIDTDWLESVHDLTPYRELIPVLPGNDGEEGTRTVKVAPGKGAAATPTKASGTVSSVPARAVQPSGKGISVDDLIKAVTPPRPTFGGFTSNQPTRAGFAGGGFRSPQNQEADLPPWARKQPVAWGGGNQPAPGGWGGGGRGGRSGGTL